MKIIIQNPVQIKLLASLVLSERIKSANVFISEIKISFDFSSVLSETDLTLIVPDSLDTTYVEFANSNGDIVFSYDIKEHTMTEYFDNEKNIIIDLSLNEGFTKLKNQEVESAELAFLLLAEEDISNGFFSEDVNRVRANNKELAFAVFGY